MAHGVGIHGEMKGQGPPNPVVFRDAGDEMESRVHSITKELGAHQKIFYYDHLAGASSFGVEERKKQHWRRTTMIKAIFRSTRIDGRRRD